MRAEVLFLKQGMSFQMTKTLDELADEFIKNHGYAALEEKLRIACDALEFYGITAIHNHESKDRSEQYWNDVGISDHGQIARETLAKIKGVG